MKIVSRLVFFAGAIAFVVFSFMGWYAQRDSMETAWDGEESMGAAIGAVVGLIFGVVAVLSSKIVFRVLALLGGAAALALTYLYIDGNSDGFTVYGVFYPSNITDIPDYALIAAGVMTLGGVLTLFQKKDF